MTIDEAIRHCEEVAWENDRKAMCVEEAYQTTEQQNCEQCAADHRQLAEWLTEYKELEAKHCDECRQIAHYDNDVKLLCLIIQDRISYVTDYGKAILEGKYSDSYEYNKGYRTALNDILDMIHEITGTEEG